MMAARKADEDKNKKSFLRQFTLDQASKVGSRNDSGLDLKAAHRDALTKPVLLSHILNR